MSLHQQESEEEGVCDFCLKENQMLKQTDIYYSAGRQKKTVRLCYNIVRYNSGMQSECDECYNKYFSDLGYRLIVSGWEEAAYDAILGVIISCPLVVLLSSSSSSSSASSASSSSSSLPATAEYGVYDAEDNNSNNNNNNNDNNMIIARRITPNGKVKFKLSQSNKFNDDEEQSLKKSIGGIARGVEAAADSSGGGKETSQQEVRYDVAVKTAYNLNKIARRFINSIDRDKVPDVLDVEKNPRLFEIRYRLMYEEPRVIVVQKEPLILK